MAAEELVLDSGIFVLIDKGKKTVKDFLTEAIEVRRIKPIVPTVVVAQYWRSGSGPQARGARLLKGCRVLPLEFDMSKRVGRLLASAGSDDIVDATVVLTASDWGADIATTDPKDIASLNETLGSRSKVFVIT